VRRGFRAATTDEARLRLLLAGHPAALVGMPTGNVLAVIDVDPRHGGTVDPRLPETFTVQTHSGGVHLGARPV